jgi:lysine 2,3-aminomutase
VAADELLSPRRLLVRGSAAESSSEPSDWRWQLRHAVESLPELEKHLRLSERERAGMKRAAEQGLPVRITPYYLGLIDGDDPLCPIRRQVVPLACEDRRVPGDWVDPLGEEAHSPAQHLVQRYPDRVLLLVSDQCGVYCRFCTRSRMVGGGVGPVPMPQLEPALRYVQSNPAIREVILSGGDPLLFGTARLTRLLQRVRQIEHLDIVRLATRVPVYLPQRIDDALVEALRPFHPLWLMTHFNHPKELSSQALAGLAKLCDAGFPVMNQTVLLRGINDDSEVLTKLFRGLVRARVKPYYLLQADPVAGTSHLRTPLAVGRRIIDKLQGNLSGIALPKFVVDTPGGMGKVVVAPNWTRAEAPGRTTFVTHRGVEVDYVDPPHEPSD